MKKTVTAIATAGLLLLAGPALADRDDRHNYRGKPDQFHGNGAAHRAYKREHRKSNERKHEQRAKHQPRHKRESHGGPPLQSAYYKEQRRARSDRREHRPAYKHESHAKGSALQSAYYKEQRSARSERREHHPAYKHDGDYRRDRGHKGRHYGRDRHHDRDRHGRRHWGRGHHGHDYSWARHHRPHRPVYRTGHHHHRPRWRPSHYHYGYQWRYLPSSFVRISVGGLGFFYSDGIFYRPHTHGYVVARPPIGAIVYSLPASAVTVIFGGYHYYVVYDTYYLWDGRGYRVVENPGIFL